MIIKILKNVFSFTFMSLFFLLLFVFYLVHTEKMSQIKKISENIYVDDKTIDESLEEQDKFLDKDYSSEIVMINQVNYDVNDYDNFDLYYNKIIDLYNSVINTDVKYLKEEEKEEIRNIYNNKKILVIGDSNSNYFKEAGIVSYDKVIPFNGVTVKKQIEKMDEYENNILNAKYIILYNGYNIKYYKNALDFANSYNKLIEKILTINPNVKIYVSSLVPATENRMLEDISQGAIHDLYKGPEYDEMLKKYFKEDYIDVKWINSVADLHLYDGLHLNQLFYNVMIPYIAYNIMLYDYADIYEEKIPYIEKNINRFISNNILNPNNADYIINAKNLEYKNKIIKLIEEVKVNDNYNIYSYLKAEIDYMMDNNGVFYFGDSNIKQFDIFNMIEKEKYDYFVSDVFTQAKEIKSYLNEDIKNIFIFNGYNIKYFDNETSYVSAYKKLADAIHEYNEDIKVYILSLLPATENAISEDLQAPFTHNIINGVPFDTAIKNAFIGEEAYYIDTKWILKPELYVGDGIHVRKLFYQIMVPYTVYWTKLYE